MDKTSLQAKSRAIKITVKGRVQGVGFRPFVFQLASFYKINGTVQNNMDGVKIYAEGSSESIKGFVSDIQCNAPRLSRIDRVVVSEAVPIGANTFTIIPSERDGKSSLVIPIDSAVCPDCLREMRDPNNFRYQYPFINCTQCGPRYTIIESLPYDRPYTVMKDFTMCEACEQEYHDPLNRRHHAQPIACDKCGPKVELISMNGRVMGENLDAIKLAVEQIHQGKIVAIKGLGGYHLACNAFNEDAVQTLRRRKKRPNRPLAVMADSMNTVRKICEISSIEEKILQSPEAPIVVVKKNVGMDLAESLAPRMKTLGVMLPYTPLHHQLFDEGKVSVLVMTSANPSGLPMLYKDEDAFSYLDGIADFVLTNNRPILHPLDDSVVQLVEGKLSFLRRSRGYVPDPIETEKDVHGVVALGPQQKNTFALGRHGQIFLGPHIGDMENLEMVEHYEQEYAHLMRWMGIEAEAIAVDMHPGYMTTQMAQSMNGRIIPVQHHHAHLVSCMEDNNLTESVLGIILDGTGVGEDGHVWGFEFLYGNGETYKRLGHLQYTHLPGNEKAIKEPWRNAAAMLIDYLGEEGCNLAKNLFPNREYEIDILKSMIASGVNSPLAGTCGRLFDAVSAILGICDISTYDGEAAVKLSELMITEHSEGPYPYEITFSEDGLETISFEQVLLELSNEKLMGVEVEKLVHRFHETIVTVCVEMITKISERNPTFNKNVVLSGGSFHNRYLVTEISRRLTLLKYNVYKHERVPCNDGGISLGQLIVAANKCK